MNLCSVGFLCGLLALGLAGPLADVSVSLQRGACPLFWYEHGGGCYKYVSSRVAWADAELHCMSLDAHLVAIHNLHEMEFVTQLIENFDLTKGGHWIGFSDGHQEGAWMWTDGSPPDFTNWSPTEPNNEYGHEHCAETYDTFQWNDQVCTAALPFVCKARERTDLVMPQKPSRASWITGYSVLIPLETHR
ncbi:hypothetical protein NHX12_023273 [Muraenolepis orangiensis]|uniref:C-type lectin domain-containing protein n=1 Tax=Muraenolepis orangiensis TaxID=630683 RepID=A0A9Q0ISL5_9TELE|nr:hypothetical protein NHX12_023273 [Muraenolepis orangiensis]